MKRDMQVVRKLILVLEEAERYSRPEAWRLNLPTTVIEYHLVLLQEAGLIVIDSAGFERLTWAGHDFADAARDDVVWKKTWRKVSETTKSITFDMLIQLLKVALAKRLSEKHEELLAEPMSHGYRRMTMAPKT